MTRDGRHDGLGAVFIAMEACWIAALALAIAINMPGPRTAGVAWALAPYPIAYVAGRLLRPHRWRLWINTATAVVLAAAAAGGLTWLVFPDPLAAPYPAGLMAATGAVTFARGWLLAERVVDVAGFAGAFQLGVFMLLMVAIVEHLGPVPTGAFVPLAAAFFAIGLLGLRFARALETGTAERHRAMATGLAVAGIAIVVTAGYLARDGIDRALIEALLAPVIWLWDMLGRLLVFLMSLLPKPEIPDLPLDPMHAHRPPPPDPKPRFNLFEWMHVAGGIMFYSAVTWMFAMVLFRTLFDLLRWLQRRRDSTPDIHIEASEFDFLDELAALVAALVALWRRLAAKLARRRPTGPPEAEAVREIYRRLLAWAAAHGHSRPAHRTAHEMLDTLRAVLPDHTFELRFVTEAYAAARYGAVRHDPGLIDKTRAAWRRIRAVRPRRAKNNKET